MRLAEKVVIVTGSATGIGAAIARRAAAEGASVVIQRPVMAKGERSSMSRSFPIPAAPSGLSPSQ
jgi:NAD(P)-dependent dehydrogenase (short-subunit alcohol dehydrogenase family)